MTLKELETEKAKSLNEAAAAKDAAGVEALRIAYLGRNGSIPAIIKGMKDVPKEERPAFGKAVQAWKAELEAALAAKSGPGEAGGVEADLTLPGDWRGTGVEHPLSRVIEETAAIFGKLGFTVADGPELENKFNNFTALNTPAHHPSMDRSDTFWFGDDCLLRVPPRHDRRDALGELPPDRGALRRHEAGEPRGPQERPRVFREGDDGRRRQGALPPPLLPLHRAVGRGRFLLPRLQGQGMRRLQAVGVDRSRGRRNGGPSRLQARRLRPRTGFRLCVRLRGRAHRDDQIRHSRHQVAVRERREVPKEAAG